MAKVNCYYFGLNMTAQGKSEFADKQAAAFLAHVEAEQEADRRSEADEKPQVETLTERQPMAGGMEWDVVAIYDNAGIPSIMHRFRRVSDWELFCGSDKPHPAFVIGGEVYDEIYISVYPNTMINGKPYSLPCAEPATKITLDDFAQACFDKGEGWHCLTAAEWGLLADISLKLKTLPHGNTKCGRWHGDEKEAGVQIEDSYKTLTGTGPATWTHDHTPTGVHDLCGNVAEFARGARIKDGALYAAENNDAALPETDLTEDGKGWKPITDDSGKPLYVSVGDGKIAFTTNTDFCRDYDGVAWGDVCMNCESEQLKELALFPGEPNALCYVDSTDGEYILIRGGGWANGGNAGVFNSNLDDARSHANGYVGGRSAYFKKH